MHKQNFSVVMPTFNEMSSGFLNNSIPVLCNHEHCSEVIVVDRNSDDGTQDFLAPHPVRIIETDANTRAERLNIGIAACHNDLVLLYHPRSFLNSEALGQLSRLPESIFWGGFTHQFDMRHWLLNFTSWYSNKVRFDFRHIVYFDHCIYLRKSRLLGDATPVPEVAIFEDTELSKKLKKISPPARFTGISLTSSIRFQRNGIIKQALLNQLLKLGYWLRLPSGFMNKLYEKGLGLNSKY